MKKIKRKALEKKLHTAIEKVLKDNKAETKNKTEKAVIKSIKKIAKKTDLKITVAAKKKESGLTEVNSRMTKLKNFPTSPSEKFSKKKCNKELEGFHKKLFDLQNVFYADARFALLIIFQGVDTSGKDGSIRHVMTSMNPMGVQVKSFKKPLEEELTHDFLWRVYPHFPAKGMIQVFNRSYYEDILVPSIEKTLPKENIEHRCQLINEVEQHLSISNIHVLKFFLHISKEVQQKRIKERLTKLSKRWKYSKDDKTAASKWGAYNDVYDTIITKCSKQAWHIIEADKRWYRNYKVAKIITTHLQSLQLKYTK